jgi:hypothetical protein
MAKRGTSVSITPAQGVYALFSAFAYTPWQALGEFIDNSVSSWMNSDAKEPLKVEIKWEPDWGEGGRLTITDNAMGIALKDFPRAFELATPPSDLTKLNQFGVGLKVAACWFGKQWTVETSVLNDPFKRSVTWNVDEIVRKNHRTLDVKESREKAGRHYTVVTITHLHHPPSGPKTIAKIKKHLPKLFRKFIRSGDMTISWNGEVLADSFPRTMVSPSYKNVDGPKIKWKTRFRIEARPDLTVDGTACIFETFDRKQTGLNYFWRERLIQGNVEPFHRPQALFGAGNSFRTGRLYIEIDASDFKVTSDKSAIDFGKSRVREEEFLKKIQEALSTKKLPLLQHAENFRSTKPPPDIRPRIDATFGSITEQAQEIGTSFLKGELKEPPGTSPSSTPEAEVDYISERVIRHKIDGKNLVFKVSCVDSGPNSPWIDIEWGRKLTTQHRVFLNIAHPFISRHLNADTLQTIIGFGVSMLYGEFKALAVVTRDELKIVRQFTDGFMRLMAGSETEINDDSDNQD